jgi:hypothetical protein
MKNSTYHHRDKVERTAGGCMWGASRRRRYPWLKFTLSVIPRKKLNFSNNLN